MKLVGVREDENLVQFVTPDSNEPRAYPLDCVTTVFHGWHSNSQRAIWQMYLQYTR